MPDFTLEPDVLEPDRPERTRAVRLVATGVAPTAEVPPSRTKELPPCYAPCEACGALILTGRTPAGTRLALDTQHATYTVDWQAGAPEPTFAESRGYPVHQCSRYEVS